MVGILSRDNLEGVCILGKEDGLGDEQELDIQDFANEEQRAEPLLLALDLPLTFHHNNVRLRADPLDFGRLLQFVAVGVVGSAALIHAGVIESEANDVNAASGVSYVRGIDLHTLVSRPIKKLGEGLIGLFTFHKPPLHLGDGGSNDLTVQLCTITSELHPRQGALNEPRWGQVTVGPANREGGQCKFKHDKCFMGNKEQWQEKEKQMEKKKEKETELLNANMKIIKHKSQTQFEF